MRAIIDRFEDGFAVLELEGGKMVNVPIEIIPKGAKEGDVVLIEIDKTKTTERQKRIKELFDELSS